MGFGLYSYLNGILLAPHNIGELRGAICQVQGLSLPSLGNSMTLLSPGANFMLLRWAVLSLLQEGCRFSTRWRPLEYRAQPLPEGV